MATTTTYFGARIQQIMDTILTNLVEMQKDVAMEVLSEVVANTPIDTGRAKSNWQVNSGSPITTFMPDAYFPGSQKSTEQQNVQMTLAVGDAAIRAHTVGDIYISNNLDYIDDLNSGTSTQAPEFFVQTAVLKGARSGIKRSLLSSLPNSRIP